MSVLDGLAELPLWVAWKYELRNGKQAKVPIDPASGRYAKSDDPTTWGRRVAAETCAVLGKLPGVGINLAGIGDGEALIGIDLDTCRDRDSGAIADWAMAVVERVASYAEISPSDTGLKVFCRMRIEDRDAIQAAIGAKGKKWVGGDGEHPPAIELYTEHRYFTVTEQLLPGAPAELRLVDAEALWWVIREAGPALAARYVHVNGHDQPRAGRGGSRSELAIRRALALARAGKVKSYAEMCAALRGDPDERIVEWVRDKGEDRGEHELKNIWMKVELWALGPPWVIRLKAPYDVADLFLRARYEDAAGRRTLLHHRDDFYRWAGVAWKETEAKQARKELADFLADDCVTRSAAEDGGWQQRPVDPNLKIINEVTDALRSKALLPKELEAPCWIDQTAEDPPARELIACDNGLLHMPSGALLPHSPRFYSHNALGFDYDAAATAPRWLDFLGQLWPEDPESVETLQEVFGYCLSDDTSQHKAFLLVGPKRSGKGTIARLLRELVGADNAAGPTFAKLSEPFGMETLIGKRVAFISDARLSGRSDQGAIAERILSITGEDALSVGRKYKSDWTGRLGVRLLVLTNEMPRVNDASGALASRFIVLALEQSFYGREDPGLTGRLLDELPGILNWAIAGWRRLRERGHFVQPAAAQDKVDEMEELGSPVTAFVRDYCEVGPGREVKVDELFTHWEIWCQHQRRERPGDKASFGNKLSAAVAGLRVVRPRQEDGSRPRVYKGIELRRAEGAEEYFDFPPRRG